MIRLEQLTFGYRRKPLLFKDFSLTIEDGSRICFTGPSGCGKSTLLRLILGLETPKSGSITGTEELSFSMVFQEDRLVPHLTALENILLFAPGREEEARRMLAKLGLSDAADSLPKELSGGMKRRVALARALLHPFDVLILDEAFTGLDEASKDLCLAAVEEALGDKTLLMVTHDLRETEILHTEIQKMPLPG